MTQTIGKRLGRTIGKRIGKRIGNCLILGFGMLAAGLTAPAWAGSPDADLLRDETVAKVPSNWQVHVSTREHALIVFLMPPYQEAFDLWYEPEKLRAKMLALCPQASDAIWRHLQPGQTVAIEPTVGGKSAEAMRLTCPHSAPPA